MEFLKGNFPKPVLGEFGQVRKGMEEDEKVGELRKKVLSRMRQKRAMDERKREMMHRNGRYWGVMV